MLAHLTDLEPEWIVVGEAPNARRRDASLTAETAQGIVFLCPQCFAKNGGPVGTHSVMLWFRDRGVPKGHEPGPGRWAVEGRGFEDLTLHPSVDLSKGIPGEWHGWIKNGVAT